MSNKTIERIKTEAFPHIQKSSNSFYVGPHTESLYDTFKDALISLYFTYELEKGDTDIITALSDPKVVKTIETAYTIHKKQELVRLGNPGGSLFSHPIKKIADSCTLLTIPDGYPAEVWIERELGGYLPPG